MLRIELKIIIHLIKIKLRFIISNENNLHKKNTEIGGSEKPFFNAIFKKILK